MTKLHLTDGQLSTLVDGAIPEPEQALLEEHLHTCRSCYLAYQDALRYRAIWETDSSVFRAPASIASIAHRTPLRAGNRSSSSPARRSIWRSWVPAMGAAAAVLAMIAAVAVWR
ncbi:MAG: zf-HC2 domain-containing protein, partial [Candidatus Krumholzibacteriota bacterium]|nr:zf-HC2 domain-containing protein [Candidatus Krumholzibacteriota bacterium]